MPANARAAQMDIAAIIGEPTTPPRAGFRDFNIAHRPPEPGIPIDYADHTQFTRGG